MLVSIKIKGIDMINPYNILGISKSADYETARQRYIQLAKKYHPDKFASNGKFSAEKMKKINNAFDLIKEAVHHEIVHIYNKGKFTQVEINEAVLRFNKGQSLNKISRDIKRSSAAIRKHLIRLGYIAEPLKRETVILKTPWYYYFAPTFHTILFIFMTISMIISGLYMGLMCFAFICLISD